MLKEIPILFESDFCMVLNKPAGLPVQGGEGVKTSLDSLLSEKYSPRPLLVHRLDRDTSGLILVAKSREAAAGFSALFAGSKDRATRHGKSEAGRSIVKQYLGVCAAAADSNMFKSGRGVIKLALEDVHGKGSGAVKESETFYRFLRGGNAGNVACSLLELELGTGRMHQIRRHLAQSGIPLLGDDKYGNFPLNRELRKVSGLRQLLLHAARLVIPPSPGLLPGGLDVTAPLPDYFSAFAETVFPDCLSELLTLTPLFP